jgi:putative glutamine amidotransferase
MPKKLNLMKAIKGSLSYIFLMGIFLVGCNHSPDAEILISKIYNPHFNNWLTQTGADLDLINMYPVSMDSVEYWLGQADGIIISGGEDVNPALYGMEEEVGKCEGIDYRRDTLEIKMIKYAIENKIPLLCICRGCQILNVANGGTLIPDIPSDFDTIIKHSGGKSKHWVNISEGTFLYNICHTTGDTVNSFHHQAVKEVAPLFRAVAYAEDSLIEAIEMADTTGHSFILGVQWHPEGMEFSNPLSGNIAKRFINETKIHSHKQGQ